MAMINEEMISNMLKSNFSHLKTFAEMLNAEFTEEGHDEENRDKYKEDVARILNKFGSCESNYQKNIRCLNQTKNEVHGNVAVDEEDCDRQTLMKDIDNIINIIEGKSKLADDEPMVEFTSADNIETKLLACLEKIEDILNEYHPLRFRDEDDEDDEEALLHEREERKLNTILEIYQKKSMKKLERSMNAADENAMEVEEDTSDEEEDGEATQRTQRTGPNNEQEKAEMDLKLKKLWKDYEREISRIAPMDLQQIFDQKLEQTMDVPFEHLNHFPGFNRSILELFSREAIVVVSERQNYMDPISKKEIRMPVRNKKCGHIYDKESVENLLRRKKDISCPCLGCSCRSFTRADLEEDEDLTEQVTQSLNRNKASSSRHSGAESMNTENLDSDNESD